MVQNNFIAINTDEQLPELHTFLQTRQYDDIRDTFDKDGRPLFSLRLYENETSWHPVGIVCVANKAMTEKIGDIVNQYMIGAIPIEKEKIASIAASDGFLYALTNDDRILTREARGATKFIDITPNKEI